jgi:hypothetical protein
MSRLAGNAAGAVSQTPIPAGAPDVVYAEPASSARQPINWGLGSYAALVQSGAVGVLCVVLFLVLRANLSDASADRQAHREDLQAMTRAMEKLSSSVSDSHHEQLRSNDALAGSFRELAHELRRAAPGREKP